MPTRISAPNRAQWLLLAIAAADGEPLTPVQLQKILFLLGERQSDAVGRQFYRFSPYNYGPFSREIYLDADELASQGLVHIDRTARGWSTYAVTPSGLDRAQEVEAAAPPPTLDYLRRVVEWARSLTFSQLVSAIYREFPDQKLNSLFVQ